MPCATIACRDGAVFQLDFPFSFETARTAEFLPCRNGLCLAGTLPAAAPPPEFDTGVGFVATDPGDGTTETAHIALWGNADGSLNLEMEWTPSSATHLADGDVYSLYLRTNDGKTHRLLNEIVTYRDTSFDLPLGACGQYCQFTERDLRGSGIPDWIEDAGTP